MPSNRRVRLLFYIVLAGCITLLLFTSNLRQTHEVDNRSIQDFYHKTRTAMDKARAGGRTGGQTVLDAKTGKEAGRTPVDKDADGDVDSDDEVLAKQMGERLRAAEQKAKELANAKAPNKPDSPGKVIGVGSSAGGQVKKAGSAVAEGKKEVLDETEVKETDEDRALEAELHRILKQAPVIIFSKTYCPYSKRAKGILLDKYHIDPAPYVVELDEHPMGSQIQDRLMEMTGRRTVPNILVGGKSIGGSDDIVSLDNNRSLADKITSLSTQKLIVEQRFIEDEKDI